jgi:hypothetical protein
MTSCGRRHSEQQKHVQLRRQAAASAKARTVLDHLNFLQDAAAQRTAIQFIVIFYYMQRGHPMTDFAAAPELLSALGLAVIAHWSRQSGDSMLEAISLVLLVATCEASSMQGGTVTLLPCNRSCWLPVLGDGA